MSFSSLNSDLFLPFRDTITSSEDSIRHRSLDSLCKSLDLVSLLEVSAQLDTFWRETSNLYHRVRAMFYLASIYRYHVPKLLPARSTDRIPFEAHEHLLSRRFTEAIDQLLDEQSKNGPGPGLASSLAKAYHQIGFQTLSDQVRKSVRSVRGNQWMFRIGHPSDHPLRMDKRMLPNSEHSKNYPILFEATSVRMDFTHSAWSDIFFLGMDFPEGAKVINASIDLGVFGRDAQPRPPVEAYLRVIDRPVLRLVSVDLGAETEITAIDEVFDFARDYLGLLKSAVIASGIVPSAMEGCHQPISKLFETLIGRPGLGLELVSRVNDIPKGSRLAVSTNLLGCLISVLMRSTGQISSFEGMLTEQDRRLVAARAILGEWLGGSGGGWQDSGGVWPGIKLIEGCSAKEGDPEFGVSRGRLLPQHTHLNDERISPDTKRALQESLILVHGGMAQNVGPILEMVTEKYLLRGDREWDARREAIRILDRMLDALRAGDLREVGHWTTVNFQGPLQAIIPWCTNLFTDTLIERSRAQYGERFWGFWMLGGMSGGGMGFIFDPAIKQEAKSWLQSTMLEVKRGMENQVPFAMDPVVYDFAINERGSFAELLHGDAAVMPMSYYAITAPKWIKQDIRRLSEQTQNELMSLGQFCRSKDGSGEWLIDRILPQRSTQQDGIDRLQLLLKHNGFDREAHQHIREEMLSGRIGLAQNRLSPQTRIEDVQSDDVIDVRDFRDSEIENLGAKLISEGQVGVVTLAAGAGSRWTGGAGVVKGLHSFCKLADQHRNFVEIHLAKSQKIADTFHSVVPHAFTTGYLTQGPIENYLKQSHQAGYRGPVYVSAGKSVGLRLIPTLRDLRFFWEEMPQQVLDEQQQKVRESARASLSQWALAMGEAADYTDNLPMQCMHPVGHWYEVPNMIRNGTLAQMIAEQPSLKFLMLHNIDTLGANIDPLMLGHHVKSQACLTFEVIGRRIEDRGGGLALVNGNRRLLEGLAMPNERAEFALSYYNSMTTWIDIDRLLSVFGLTRSDLSKSSTVDESIREFSKRLPTYITIKDVKKRWGQGQEDIFPVAQFEKLWGDMSSLSEVACEYLVVDTMRGQQLKDPAQLDGWVRDGSSDYVESLCAFD